MRKIKFEEIIKDIIENKYFNAIKNEKHHGINRLEHSLNVAKVTYLIAKKTKMSNYVQITRAALLHDFFQDSEVKKSESVLKHAKIAAENAKKYFNISDMEYNMIASHMFPLSIKYPSSKGAILLTTTDKIVATYEVIKYMIPNFFEKKIIEKNF